MSKQISIGTTGVTGEIIEYAQAVYPYTSPSEAIVMALREWRRQMEGHVSFASTIESRILLLEKAVMGKANS
jgi:hypothetical protein